MKKTLKDFEHMISFVTEHGSLTEAGTFYEKDGLCMLVRPHMIGSQMVGYMVRTGTLDVVKNLVLDEEITMFHEKPFKEFIKSGEYITNRHHAINESELVLWLERLEEGVYTVFEFDDIDKQMIEHGYNVKMLDFAGVRYEKEMDHHTECIYVNPFSVSGFKIYENHKIPAEIDTFIMALAVEKSSKMR